MIRIAVRQLVSRRTATALSGLGLLTATLGFVILASTATTTEAALTGDITRAWTTPYDILVRPPSSVSSLERSQGLVRPNFLNATNGGITLAQLRDIRAIPGVAVAAPIAVAGAFYHYSLQHLDLSRELSGAEVVAFRISTTHIADAGLSRIPQGTPSYALGAADGTVILQADGSEVLQTPSRTITCPAPSPGSRGLLCFGARVRCAEGVQCPQLSPADLMPGISLEQPVIIAGIDPPAEAQLAGLDRCITSGHWLDAADRPGTVRSPAGAVPVVPVIYSARTFLDESVQVHVDRVLNPPTPRDAGDMVALPSWSPAGDRGLSAQELYDYILTKESGQQGGLDFTIAPSGPLVVPGDVAYRAVGSDHLEAATVPSNPAVVAQNSGPGAAPQIPPELTDTWFRGVTAHRLLSAAAPQLQPVGRYNPDCLASFDALAGGRLENYAPPDVRLPSGAPLGPNGSVAGYVNSPPALLTTLSGIAALDDPSRYQGAPGAAPISAIRIRVANVESPTSESERRLADVAAAISDRTGLAVDVVKGASPRVMKIDLAAGRFGRPALTVSEPWSVKGVSVRFLQQVSSQNIAMFALVLAGAGVLVAQTAYVSVRRRRREFAVLRALGWPSWRIGALVEAEMLLLGVVAGALAVALGLPMTRAASLQVQVWQLALVVPLAVVVAALAAVLPAWSAGRGTVTSRLGAGDASPSRRSPSSVVGAGLADLLVAWRVEALFGALAVALGATLLGGIVLLAVSFTGQLDNTRLGVDLAARVRPFHIALGLLTVAVGAAAVAEVVLLSYLERRGQYGILRALGWPASRVARILVGQALALGAVGGGIAVVVVLAGGALLGAGAAAMLAGAATALGMGLVATLLAGLGPLALLFRSPPAEVLRGE